MDHRLLQISKAIAQSAINAYYGSNMFSGVHSATGALDITRKVYDELVIGVKCKVNTSKLAKLATTAALIAHQKNRTSIIGGPVNQPTVAGGDLFTRAHIAALAALQKMIRETNHQRRYQLRLAEALNF